MINVQDPTEFSCQVLNRDLWSDTIVKDIVKESFIFLQVSKIFIFFYSYFILSLNINFLFKQKVHQQQFRWYSL